MRTFSLKAAVAAVAIAMAAPAIAAPCQNTTNFDQWLADFKKEALAQGISQQILDAASPSLTIDPAIIKRDRGQAVFSQTFLQFSDRMVAPYRMQNGAAMADAAMAIATAATAAFNENVRIAHRP
jgi:membrane-bound lytic murein transglycosylase B